MHPVSRSCLVEDYREHVSAGGRGALQGWFSKADCYHPLKSLLGPPLRTSWALSSHMCVVLFSSFFKFPSQPESPLILWPFMMPQTAGGSVVSQQEKWPTIQDIWVPIWALLRIPYVDVKRNNFFSLNLSINQMGMMTPALSSSQNFHESQMTQVI